MPDLTGCHLGHYRLRRRVGGGGYADVYEAVDVFLDRVVAVKVLKVRVDPRDAEAIHHCALEARTLAHLEHPHIVSVIEFDTKDTIAYIVLEYAQNGSLRDIHQAGEHLEWNTILYYLEQITEALTFIHEHNIVHLDVKPANILMNENYELLLSDFGTVMFISHTEPQVPPPFIGTIQYAAPERFTNAQPTPASDIYSLAVVVFEWYTGKALFTGTTTQIIRQHTTVVPSTRRMSALGIKSPIRRVLLKALAKDPEKRYQRVADFYEALTRAVREVDNKTSRWIEMAFVALGSVLAFLAASVVVDLNNVSPSVLWQLCLPILPILYALIRKNWIALWFFVVGSLVALVSASPSHSWVTFDLTFLGSLLISSCIGFIRRYTSRKAA